MVIKAPKAASAAECERLEQLPNIGPSLAADLRLIGIERPADLRGKDAYALYRRAVRGDRPAPGPVRARHLHGGHRFHARRRRRAVVEVHRRAQGDLRRALSRCARCARTRPARDPPIRAFAAAAAREQSVAPALAGAAVAAPCSALSSPALLSVRPASPRAARRERIRRSASRRAPGRPAGRLARASGWRVSASTASSFGQRGRLDALAAARLDFADALFDVHTAAGGAALDRIAVDAVAARALAPARRSLRPRLAAP